MKNNITLLLLLCLFTLLTASKCKKNAYNPNSDNNLPPATQIGANIFACKVNGSNWISKRSSPNLGAGVASDTLFIYASNPETSSFYERFDIRIHNYSVLLNLFSLDDSLSRYVLFSTNKQCFNSAEGLGIGKGKSYNGEIILTKDDKINKILSGTFWFNIKTDYCDTLKITDGRFDIKYY